MGFTSNRINCKTYDKEVHKVLKNQDKVQKMKSGSFG